MVSFPNVEGQSFEKKYKGERDEYQASYLEEQRQCDEPAIRAAIQ
jgi:hypothetical protein